jgi:hypothetical protein
VKRGHIAGMASVVLFFGWFALFGAPFTLWNSSDVLFLSVIICLIGVNVILVIIAVATGSKWWLAAVIIPLWESLALAAVMMPEHR